MPGYLLVIQGPRQGQVFPLGERTVVGRSDEASIQILDHAVSRNHLEIVSLGDGRYQLHDLGSTSGTLVNQQRSQRVILAAGDEIQIGASVLLFRDVDPEIEARESTVKLLKGDEEVPPDIDMKRVIDVDRIDWLTPEDDEDDVDPRVQHALALMFRVGNLLNSQRDADQLFGLVMDSLFEVVPADRGFIVLYDPSKESFKPAVIRHRYRTAQERLRSGPIQISRSIIEDCVKTGVSIICSDAMTDARYRDGKSVLLNQIRSVICAPLRSQKEILGAIYLDCLATSGAFEELDLELVSAIGKQSGIAIERTRLLQRVEEAFMGTVRALVASIEAKDPYTRGHSERVASIAVQIAQELDLDAEETHNLYLASILHDVGKIGIDEAILRKPDKLTDAEYRIIKTHPTVGADILRGINEIDDIIFIVEHHHERLDGTGFPDGLSGEEINVATRIIAVADSYDAMVTHRPYRPAMSEEQCLDELRRLSGRLYDTRVVEALEGLATSNRLEARGSLFEGKKLPSGSEILRRGATMQVRRAAPLPATKTEAEEGLDDPPPGEVFDPGRETQQPPPPPP